VYGHGHVKLYEEIAAFFGRGEPFSVSHEDALATIKLLNSFYISDETGGWVDVAGAGDSARLGTPDESLADLYRTPAPVPQS
jgi:UDP-N-acetyl-2-amino-2-deoxyglucuronate dehydrogenase